MGKMKQPRELSIEKMLSRIKARGCILLPMNGVSMVKLLRYFHRRNIQYYWIYKGKDIKVSLQ